MSQMQINDGHIGSRNSSAFVNKVVKAQKNNINFSSGISSSGIFNNSNSKTRMKNDRGSTRLFSEVKDGSIVHWG